MVSMLEEVMRTGTAAGVRWRGFTVPAAGKTGTSHDGWFAGFTSDLLCIVWVGFDDNRELNIEGAHSALPIWTEFMKRAIKFRQYADAKTFSAPDGVVTVTIDPQSGIPATPHLSRAEAGSVYRRNGARRHLPAARSAGRLRCRVGKCRRMHSRCPARRGPTTRRCCRGAAICRRLRRYPAGFLLRAALPRTPTIILRPSKKKKGFFGRLKDVFK